ncbi:MAG: peptidoglycan editing factor PgeF [Nitrospirota bacterium]|nr:peptidoglycan editing factor PgeF [Nitrospirota bacterium]
MGHSGLPPARPLGRNDPVSEPHAFCRRGESPPADTVTTHQVHGSAVLYVAGTPPVPAAEQGDALITDQPGVAVGVRTADCQPLLLSARNGAVVAAVHAGWRGTVEGITTATVDVFRRRFGVQPEEIDALLGPSIRPCCYEVGPEVADQVRTRFPRFADRVIGTFRSGRPTLDVATLNRLQLEAAGVRSIHDQGGCTHCGTGYESYRRDGDAAGRMVAWIRCATTP